MFRFILPEWTSGWYVASGLIDPSFILKLDILSEGFDWSIGGMCGSRLDFDWSIVEMYGSWLDFDFDRLARCADRGSILIG